MKHKRTLATLGATAALVAGALAGPVAAASAAPTQAAPSIGQSFSISPAYYVTKSGCKTGYRKTWQVHYLDPMGAFGSWRAVCWNPKTEKEPWLYYW